MSKAPAFQFYPEDWLSSVKLQLCSVTAKGLMIDLMCLMHMSDKYGFLLINGVQIDDKSLAKVLRMNTKPLTKALQQLVKNGVLKKDDSGVLYCKRMVEDDRLREIRKASGKLGGNPNLVNHKVNSVSKSCTPPSSSSSSSTSTKENISKDISKKTRPPKKKKYLDFLFLTDRELEKLKDEYHLKYIDEYTRRLNEYVGSTGKQYKSHYMTIRSWLRNDGVYPVSESENKEETECQQPEQKKTYTTEPI